MDRYSKVINKNLREIVLLKALPCIWGKCAFCDYIDDNDDNIAEINKLNKEVLNNITGEFGVLEVINSGSCFEIPRESLEYIKKIVVEGHRQTHPPASARPRTPQYDRQAGLGCAAVP